MNRGCVWIILISTNTARRIPSRSHASTRSSTLQLAASCSPSSTAIRVTTRSLSRKKIRSEQHSSPPLKHMHKQQCPSRLRIQEPPISRPSNCALWISYIATLKLMWMMWSSRPDPMMSSSLISRKHSTAYASFDGSLAQPSASSACHKGNYSVSSLVTEELKQTRRRSPPSQPWMLHE
jgi:hypothetical protein